MQPTLMLRVVHRPAARPVCPPSCLARAAGLICCWSSRTAVAERSGRRGSAFRRYKNDADNTGIAVLGRQALRKGQLLRQFFRLANRLRAAVLKADARRMRPENADHREDFLSPVQSRLRFCPPCW